MRSRGMRSPDEWDSIALTFAEPGAGAAATGAAAGATPADD